jgi:glucosamine-6-phosphate deaminase
LFPTRDLAAREVAAEVAKLIRSRFDQRRMVVLGLATGSTPIPLYAELVRLHREEKLSFANVITFNLDEYFPMPAENPHSYHRFMRTHLFDHVDLAPENTNLPDGSVPHSHWKDHCAEYERRIQNAGGIDLQILGIGRTGHIGFNEPGSSSRSRTRLVELDSLTIEDAAPTFGGEDGVPRRALTMGIGTILEARRILLIAWGAGKAAILREALEGEICDHVPASLLREHGNVTFVLDHAAAGIVATEQRKD